VSRARPPSHRGRRGVALVNALLVVAGLAAISAALLLRAGHAIQRQGLREPALQVAAYLDAAQARAMAELAAALAVAAGGQEMPDLSRPREIAFDRGRIGWTFAPLDGRFNLNWLGDPGEWGQQAARAFAQLAEGQGLSTELAARLARAAGPDATARAAAVGSRTPPDLPLLWPGQLLAALRPGDGGAAALAPLWPLVAALPPEAGLNPGNAPLPVMQALVPGLSAAAWARFEAERASGLFDSPDVLIDYASALWPDAAFSALVRLPLDNAPDRFELSLTARLDSLMLRRSVVVALDPGADPERPALRVLLAVPIVE